ncbi:hypothetical protein [Mycobacterium sp.]
MLHLDQALDTALASHVTGLADIDGFELFVVDLQLFGDEILSTPIGVF